MTRANRERKKTKKINIMKCMYDLPRFDSHFECQVSLRLNSTFVIGTSDHVRFSYFQLHNKYFRAKKRCRENHAAIQFHKLVIDRLEDIVQDQEDHRSIFDRRFDTVYARCKVDKKGFFLSSFYSIYLIK